MLFPFASDSNARASSRHDFAAWAGVRCKQRLSSVTRSTRPVDCKGRNLSAGLTLGPTCGRWLC
eukprot:9579615-Alexandrium_andersonii.AAC.1